MDQTVSWTVHATTMCPVTAFLAVASVVLVAMAATVNWSVRPDSLVPIVLVLVNATTVPPVTPVLASVAVPQALQVTPVLMPALQGSMVSIVVRSVSVESTHATEKLETASAHLALRENTVLCHAGQAGMGGGANKCVSATMVAHATLLQVTAHAPQDGSDPSVMRRTSPSLLRVISEDGQTFPSNSADSTLVKSKLYMTDIPL